MNEIEQVLALLRERPQAARLFLRPTVAQILARALARGYVIRGEL